MTTTTYTTDLYGWAQRQVELLRAEDFEGVDWGNVIEEIEALGASEQRELDSRLTVALEHLLKLECEPTSRARGRWQRTILTQRLALAKLLQRNHTLRATINDYIDPAYQDARKLAAAGSTCAVTEFPDACPWTVAQIMDEAFWP